MLGTFVGAVREPTDIRALLEGPLPHYNAMSRSATACGEIDSRYTFANISGNFKRSKCYWMTFRSMVI
jgi:hypothetical protein